MLCQVISIKPNDVDGDLVVTASQIPQGLHHKALCIRTMPNTDNKTTKQYSDTNPPYMAPEAMKSIVSQGVEHLLIDTPSVDREEDKGALASHHLFWNYPQEIDRTKTITELIYIPSEIEDGEYLMELQFAPFENDASPSRPVLYRLLD
jgi:kynurenine formamidase